jgi:xanthine dehydrogenase accessory factor
LATVVRAQRPTSAKAGDSALVLADGTLDGFVGGTCAESTVRSVGLQLLESGASTLLRITPDTGAQEAHEGLLVVNNPCLSGGTLEIFMEPMLPARLIQVYGDAPVARALLRVGEAIGYDMSTGDGVAPDTAAVLVASHGHGEEAVLEAAVRARVPYIGLIASRRRGDAVLASLGLSRDQIHTPAGLDIGARSASEIAVSIFAEIIAVRPVSTPDNPPAGPSAGEALAGEALAGEALAGEALAGEALAGEALAGEALAPSRQECGQPSRQECSQPSRREFGQLATDPVCGMSVEISPTALYADHAGQTYYFCASGCKAAFLADPKRYLPAA